MRIYVASSWRNKMQPRVVAALREAGHAVYDFRDPDGVASVFTWDQIDPYWRTWSPSELRLGLNHPIAIAGFESDLTAMEWADACVLVQPCGKSTHLEAGWFSATPGKKLYVLLSSGDPELMLRLADKMFVRLDELVSALSVGEE